MTDPDVEPAAATWPPPIPANTRANLTLQGDTHPTDHNQIADALTLLVGRDGYPGVWTPAPLSAGFTNFAGYTPACYRVVGPAGRQRVELSAMLVIGTTLAQSTTIIAMGAALAPAYAHLFHATTSNVANAAPNGMGDVRIMSTGNIQWFGAIVGTAPVNAGWMAFEMFWPLGATV